MNVVVKVLSKISLLVTFISKPNGGLFTSYHIVNTIYNSENNMINVLISH